MFIALLGLARVWIRLAVLLHPLGRQTMARDSADLWFGPLTPHSVASDHAEAIGTVCEAIGAVVRRLFFLDVVFFFCYRTYPQT